MSQPKIFLGVPVFLADEAMVREAIESFLDPLVQVLVIDNGASAEARRGIAAHGQSVDVLRNERNVYVNPAWNQIAERFLSSDADVLVIANEDLVTSRGWAAALLQRAIAARQKGEREMWFGRRTHQLEEAKTPRALPAAVAAKVDSFSSGLSSEDDAWKDVESTQGEFFALARASAELVFPIPEDLLIWYGDNWIIEILGLSGHKLVTLRDVVVWHKGSVSCERLPEMRQITQGHDRERGWLTHVRHRSRREVNAIHRDGRLDEVERRYLRCRDVPSDINQHLPILRAYADRCESVTEFGAGRSSWSLLHARPKRFRSYDLEGDPRGVHVREIEEVGRSIGVDAAFALGNSLEITIEPTDLLFINTLHTYVQLTRELERHAPRVRKYILLHDTETYGERGEDGASPGLMGAVDDFLMKHFDWKMRDHLKHNNGLTILERWR
jgi:GT2 family glycosyltransferase